MPNWCNTHITFYSKNEVTVNDLHSKLMQYSSIPCKGCKDAIWLGNILLNAGIGTLEEIKAENTDTAAAGWRIQEIQSNLTSTIAFL